jgi:preprotein translocase subunit SecG
MIYVVIAVHVIVCLFLIAVVLLQSGKAADLAGAFGGMGSQTTFGPRGSATLLTKLTTIAAGCFMLTSLTLAIMQTRAAGKSTSVLERTGVANQKPAEKKAAPAPANPMAPAPNSGPIQVNPGSPSGVQVTPVTPVTPTPAAPKPAEPAKK